MAEIIRLLLTILMVASLWRVFAWMGRWGWEGLIPLYNVYRLFQFLYGDGWRGLLLLVPVLNLWIYAKACVDLARSMDKSAFFGVALAILPLVFWPLLAFGDELSDFLDQIGTGVPLSWREQDEEDDEDLRGYEDVHYSKSHREPARPAVSMEEAQRRLSSYRKLVDAGLMTREEYNIKRAEILRRK